MIIKFLETRDFDDDFAVKALPVKGMDEEKWCRVQGHQLKLALKPEREHIKQFYTDEGWYYFVNTEEQAEWREV